MRNFRGVIIISGGGGNFFGRASDIFREGLAILGSHVEIFSGGVGNYSVLTFFGEGLRFFGRG